MGMSSERKSIGIIAGKRGLVKSLYNERVWLRAVSILEEIAASLKQKHSTEEVYETLGEIAKAAVYCAPSTLFILLKFRNFYVANKEESLFSFCEWHPDKDKATPIAERIFHIEEDLKELFSKASHKIYLQYRSRRVQHYR